MVEMVRNALDAGHPSEMLGLVGVMVETLMPHVFSYPHREDRIDPNPAIDAISSQMVPEYTAVLALLAEIAVGDENVQSRCRKALTLRADAVPQWIAGLSRLEVYGAIRLMEALGDCDQIMFGVRLVDGQELTCGVLIDHVKWSMASDVAVWPASMESVLARIDLASRDGRVVDMTPADARAWIEKGIENAIVPRTVVKQPGCRAVARWLIAQLPTGGESFQREKHDWQAASELMDTFFESPTGKRFDSAEFGEVLESLMEMGTGDPLRWSASRISFTMRDFPTDWEQQWETLLRVPALLRAFVPFAHSRSGIRAELTAETLAAIDDVQMSVEERVSNGLRGYWDRAV
ncbi:hypothetical protein ACXPWS_22200 [Mycobacterium sp. BMJ-28]